MNNKLSELLKDYPDIINFLERKQNRNLEEYLEYALEHGCFIRTDKNVSKNCVTQRYTLASKIVDPDSGFEVIFETTFDRPNGFDGSSFLFFFCEDAWLRGINRCNECSGIPLWETSLLLKKIKVCDVCKKHVQLNELHHHHYAGACCDDCLSEQEKDWNDNLSYYTS